MNNNLIDEVRNLYIIICNQELGDDAESVQKKINILKRLERLTNSDFKDTSDFHNKVSSFLARKTEDSLGTKLRKARKKKKWSQSILALQLGTAKSHITEMEKDERPLTENAIKFIESIAEISSRTGDLNKVPSGEMPKKVLHHARG